MRFWSPDSRKKFADQGSGVDSSSPIGEEEEGDGAVNLRKEDYG
jgi:hypothetical protein